MWKNIKRADTSAGDTGRIIKKKWREYHPKWGYQASRKRCSGLKRNFAVSLVEIYVDENSKYKGKLLSEIPKKENTLVIMIQRGEQVIIPHGNIRLESGDMLVVSKTEI